MEKYLGVKIVSAEPAWYGSIYTQEGNSCSCSGPEIIPKSTYAGDKPSSWKDGYEVIYEDGYRSWSPREVFEKAYKHFDESAHSLLIEMEPSMNAWSFKDKNELKSRAIDIARTLPAVDCAESLLMEAKKIVRYLSVNDPD